MKELPDLMDYRPNVGICLLNQKGEVWLGERASSKKTDPTMTFRWQMPQGGMDPGEIPEETAKRELWEETGVRSADLLMVTPGWLVYDFPLEYRARKKNKWLGQRQKWALMLFTGDDAEVDLAAHEEQEFTDWRWAEIETLPELVVPFKRGVYEALMQSFRPMVEFLKQKAT